jgi:hypothetical protein
MRPEHRRPEVDGYRLQEGIPLAWLAPALGTAPATSARCAEKAAEMALLFLKGL